MAKNRKYEYPRKMQYVVAVSMEDEFTLATVNASVSLSVTREG